ncbi:hypothetical protein JMJ77_0001891 [Colletotrichum scovillei]|uniref:Uncharacterized protein n=1 Tax=Colletotrichum scovillei TaxID=1209932 RepID=A0A9P7R9P8_9PEZI|nr:hypothetical protein JMJ77_0001891 [Colletotrichum scovillei]KAG7070302.1 hypothetical protein JMJ76_0001557 [Colletotrichum scovillei]KAG7078553.1 hypothetical protein JMJ78_0002223 [Colletotrichum scovillei]
MRFLEEGSQVSSQFATSRNPQYPRPTEGELGQARAKWYETMFSLPLPRLYRPSKGHLTRNHGPRTSRQIKGRNLSVHLTFPPLEDAAWVCDGLSASHAVAPGGSTSRRSGLNALAVLGAVVRKSQRPVTSGCNCQDRQQTPIEENQRKEQHRIKHD